MAGSVTLAPFAQAVQGADDAGLAGTDTTTQQNVEVMHRKALLLGIEFCHLLPDLLGSLIDNKQKL